MAAQTTLNMNLDVRERISSASKILGKSRSEIVIMLLMEMLARENTKVRRPGAVQYQKKEAHDTWKPFHITLKDQEYDYFQHLKTQLKMSLSFAVTYAVNKYLDEML